MIIFDLKRQIPSHKSVDIKVWARYNKISGKNMKKGLDITGPFITFQQKQSLEGAAAGTIK